MFLDDEDRETYLALLAKHASSAELDILGYCLRTNHMHLIVVPKKRDSMATAFRHVHGSYSQRLGGTLPAVEMEGSARSRFRHSGDLDRLREATRTGRPFGTDDFVAELEAKLDRNLFPQKPGPKPKEALQVMPSGARMEIGS